MTYSEAETRVRFVRPKLINAGWDSPPNILREDYLVNQGKIAVVKGKARRASR